MKLKPTPCPICGTTNQEGPYDGVFFCDDCGRTIRPGDTAPDVRARERDDARRANRRRKAAVAR